MATTRDRQDEVQLESVEEKWLGEGPQVVEELKLVAHLPDTEIAEKA